jgi:WxcM-like, C-terminal.
MKRTKIIQLFTSKDVRGNLSFFEENNPIPFKIRCAYWIYNQYQRQGYVHKYGEEFIVALSGSCDIVVDNGKIKKTYILTDPSYGLYIPNLHWSIIKNFSKYSVLLIITSCKVDKIDCIYDYDEFLNLLNK